MEKSIDFNLNELRIIKSTVKSAESHKLLVISRLDYFSASDNQNHVGILYCGKSVRYYEAGSATHKLSQCLLDFDFGS